MLSKQHLQVEIAFEAKQVDTLVGLLNENYGVALLSRRVIEAHPNIKSIPIVNPIHRDTVLVSPRQSLQHKICQNFIDSMMHHIDECE
jgi:DNA-binding transcriptional LysR family regulator